MVQKHAELIDSPLAQLQYIRELQRKIDEHRRAWVFHAAEVRRNSLELHKRIRDLPV